MNRFDSRLQTEGIEALKSAQIETIQINLGRRCNLACTHCHLECSASRIEQMTWHTMSEIFSIADSRTYDCFDITGGAPELHPHFRDFVAGLRQRNQPVQVRTNLVALMEKEQAGDMAFLRDYKVTLAASLPCYLEENVRAQRGTGVYQQSIEVIRQLNALGYGSPDGPALHLVYNPGNASLPGSQTELAAYYRCKLHEQFGIVFNQLLTITNMPIGRFRNLLGDQAKTYQALLEKSFNIKTINQLMCCHQISIDWDGTLYDCDFNIALGLPVNHGISSSLDQYNEKQLLKRCITTGDHCFGCTAGSGSSCSGTLTAFDDVG